MFSPTYGRENAVNDIDWAWLFFSFEGRINRAKFWLGIVVLWAIVWVLAIIAAAANSGFLWGLVAILGVVIIWPSLALSIKRWHDRNKSGWWVLIGLVPIIGGLWALIETGFLPGTIGPNEYGLDPLGPVAR
jgi:uncharacterized membrane protein YhaH (DUF805 family)